MPDYMVLNPLHESFPNFPKAKKSYVSMNYKGNLYYEYYVWITRCQLPDNTLT